MSLYDDLKVPTLINAAGPVTRYGGSCLSPRVLAAMAEATHSYVRLDELQLAAGRKLAAWTGAEAGYVTTGAAAGLTLGAAAMMAGLDIRKMEQLPNTDGIPNHFLVQRSHLSDYDHAIRASGAELHPVDCPDSASLQELTRLLESEKRDKTCGTAYVFRTSDRGVPLEVWTAASHDLGLPVLVDASVRLPPRENLRLIPGTGADLVAFSGGKAIQGPQGTGFLVGRKDLIASVLLQNQDMDVNAETWFLREWIKEGLLPEPPRNGIGRGYKVSKESILGLLAALEEYLATDPGEEVAHWNRVLDAVLDGLKGVPGCRAERSAPGQGSFPVPMAVFRLEKYAPLSLVEFVNACAALERPILFEEGPLKKGYLVIHPMCLSLEDARALVKGVRRVLGSRRNRQD